MLRSVRTHRMDDPAHTYTILFYKAAYCKIILSNIALILLLHIFDNAKSYMSIASFPELH